MKLVDDWKQAWRWLSVNAMVAATAIQVTWTGMSDDLKAALPHNLVHYLTILLLVLGIAGRLIKQGSNNADSTSAPV